MIINQLSDISDAEIATLYVSDERISTSRMTATYLFPEGVGSE